MTVRGPDLGRSGGPLCRRVAWSRGFRGLRRTPRPTPGSTRAGTGSVA